MPRGRRKITAEDRAANADRGGGVSPCRPLSVPRSCAWCGIRDGYLEYLDHELGKWFAVCDPCNTPVPAPPDHGVEHRPRRTWKHLGPMAEAAQLRAYRQEALAAGKCTICRARDARPERLTCGLCSQRASERKAANDG